MEKICLVQAGRFLIGIDAALICSTRSIDRYVADEETPLLHLESFFAQQSLAALTGYVLELENESELPALLIDRVIGEINVPARFEPLPLLYPQLAAACCPRIFVDEQQVYLLLDVEKIEQTHEQLHTDYGFALLDELPDVADVKVEEEYTEPLVAESVESVVAVEEHAEQPEEQDESSDAPPEDDDEKNEAEAPVVEEAALPDPGYENEDTAEVVSTTTITDLVPEEDSPVPDYQDDSSAEQENTQPLTGISDEILQKIVSWTIGQYIGRDQNEKAVINATDLPLAFVQPQGLSLANVQVRRDMMQNIINKTVWRCEQLNEASLQQLKKKYGKS